jgi:hypothetical protein
MATNLAMMRMALRVLSAITDERLPLARDVAELRRLAPGAIALPMDELAYRVIQQALRSRARPEGSSEAQTPSMQLSDCAGDGRN